MENKDKILDLDSFTRQFSSLLKDGENVANYFYLLVHLTSFFSIFFLLYGVYKQDIRRSRVLSRDSNGLLRPEDRELVQKREKERIFKFFPPLLVSIVIPSLVVAFFSGQFSLTSGSSEYENVSPPHFPQ